MIMKGVACCTPRIPHDHGKFGSQVSMADFEVITPGGGERLTVRGSNLLFKAVAANTGGAFSLHERQIPAGGRRPPADRLDPLVF